MINQIVFISVVMFLLTTGFGCVSPKFFVRESGTLGVTSTFPHPTSFFGNMIQDVAEIERLTKDIKLNPEDTALYLQRGMAYKSLIFGQSFSSNTADYEYIADWTARARADFTYVIDHDPKNATAYFERATLLGNDLPEQRVQDLTVAINLFPGNGLYYFYRGLNYIDQNKYAGGLQDLDKAIQFTTDTAQIPFIKLARARALVHEGKYTQARKEYDEVVKSIPLYQDAADERAQLLKRIK